MVFSGKATWQFHSPWNSRPTLQEFPFDFFENHVLTRARSVRTVGDELGRHTLYAGAPKAPWMLRVYTKTEGIVRVEFVFRRPFLIKQEIGTIQKVTFLRDVELGALATFPAVCHAALDEALSEKASGWRRRALLEWPGRRPLHSLLEVLHGYGIGKADILRRTIVQEMLASMQSEFTW